MESDTERPSLSFRYDGRPSAGVINAVAWCNGADPTTLTPLQEVIDVDALDALMDAPDEGSVSITFDYEGCTVQVTGDGTLNIRGTAHSMQVDPEQARTVLLLAPLDSTHDATACNELLSALPSSPTHVLGVTFDSPSEEQLDTWEFDGDSTAQISIITVGDFTRSAASRGSEDRRPIDPVRVDTVADPDDLTTLGRRVSDQFSEWDLADEQPVVCFRSLTALLETTDLERVFRFLHIQIGRLSSAGANAHFHLDPRAHDDQTVDTIRPLFDTVLDVDDDGTWTISVQ
jgi:hypothetical protein